MRLKIISGGQTGVDPAALDGAVASVDEGARQALEFVKGRECID